MKILVLGDIYGRKCWIDIINKESPDKIIFLGDYVSTHENISSQQQINNLENIFEFKLSNKESVILLRGNHDIQYLKYYWARCSGYDCIVSNYMYNNKELFLNNSQWIYTYDNIIFSHAGISQKWLEEQQLNLNNINNILPCDKFGFISDNPLDYSGDSITQSCTWIRPYSLSQCNIKGYDQVVGHTPVDNIINMKALTKYNQNIWLCDTLPNQYLTIIDREFKINIF